MTRRSRRLLVELREQAPADLDGHPIARTVPLDTNDGFKFFLADGTSPPCRPARAAPSRTPG